MAFSAYLDKTRGKLKEIVDILGEEFAYASVLGTDVCATNYRVDRNTAQISDGRGECGFVFKMTDGKNFYEYSVSNINKGVNEIAEEIISSCKKGENVYENVDPAIPSDEPLKKSFSRESDFGEFSDAAALEFCRKLNEEIVAADERVLNAIVMLAPYEVSKIFISKNRELDQNYGWVNGRMMVVYGGERTVMAREGWYSHKIKEVTDVLPTLKDKLLRKARKLCSAKPIKPGVYDVITDTSITGLIAHEAFGHGVEMDQFVKNRALAKEYVGKYVASPITNMRDGAASTLSAASYFFDDDGVLAHDTQIIKDGVLIAGISDLTSAMELGTEPTGNGRRESFKRKAYSRMTNTFFERGKDKLEDMIRSVKHGYMLFETNNGMEDPKNWQIQCTAEYGIEIIDGELTDNYISPVVMSGSVPELLKSITMISDGFNVAGEGMCGKGYKEWVYVSDGGANLKLKVKLA